MRAARDLDINLLSRLASIGVIHTKASEADVKEGCDRGSERYRKFGDGLDGINDDSMPDWFPGLADGKGYL